MINDITERLSLRLPKGTKKEWKEKAKQKKFSYVWTYLKHLVDDDSIEGEINTKISDKIWIDEWKKEYNLSDEKFNKIIRILIKNNKDLPRLL